MILIKIGYKIINPRPTKTIVRIIFQPREAANFWLNILSLENFRFHVSETNLHFSTFSSIPKRFKNKPLAFLPLYTYVCFKEFVTLRHKFPAVIIKPLFLLSACFLVLINNKSVNNKPQQGNDHSDHPKVN